ncbi:MAG: hypothetical protein O3A82_18085 [Verrucomicrobia bacterium]|nr:hypothetical protein [Verrucomicrobiota bacterium]
MCVRDWERERLPLGYSFLALFLVVIASPTGRGNPVGGVVCAAHGSAGLPRRDCVPPRNDRVWVGGERCLWFRWIAASGLCPSSQ